MKTFRGVSVTFPKKRTSDNRSILAQSSQVVLMKMTFCSISAYKICLIGGNSPYQILCTFVETVIRRHANLGSKCWHSASNFLLQVLGVYTEIRVLVE